MEVDEIRIGMEAERGHELVRLRNGVFSVRCLRAGETMHPVLGPMGEARTLYAGQLPFADLIRSGEEPALWDIGLGAAANAIAILECLKDAEVRVRLVSVDSTSAPLRFALDHEAELGYPVEYRRELRELLDAGETLVERNGMRCRWTFHQIDWIEFLQAPVAQASAAPSGILYDMYSPAKCPALWTLDVFRLLRARLQESKPCILVSYSRSTMIRATLLLAGFYVGRGVSIAEKEETTLATNCPAFLKHPLDERWLSRARHSTSAEPLSGPVYEQRPISEANWEQLIRHPQF